MQWVIGIAVLLLAVFAAGQMARRKGYSRGAWRGLTLLFPPLLLVLLVLPKARSGTTSVAACAACGGSVSSEADICPHCGHPQSWRATRPWYSPVAEVLGTGAVLVMVVGIVVAWLGGGEETGRLEALSCDQLPEKSQRLAAYLKETLSKPEMQLALARNDTRALCNDLNAMLPKIRQVSEAEVRCKSDDQSALFIDQLFSRGLSDCQ